MWHATIIAALLPVVAGAPRGEDKPTKPKSPPPRKAEASAAANGILFLTVTESRQVPAQETRIVQKDGVVLKEIVTVFRPVNVTYSQRWEIKDIQAFDKDWQKIAAAELPKLLKMQTPVLVSADGKKVHPSYLKDTKAGTVILVLPKPVGPAPKDGALPRTADKR
jgi:hypothetical protein